MNDLISRSALYNKLVELETLARNRVLDTPINSPCYQRYVSQMNERTMLKELVADLPTAYDVEKVVEAIKKTHCKKCRNILGVAGAEEYCKGQKCEIEELCDIVRIGGVE